MIQTQVAVIWLMYYTGRFMTQTRVGIIIAHIRDTYDANSGWLNLAHVLYRTLMKLTLVCVKHGLPISL